MLIKYMRIKTIMLIAAILIIFFTACTTNSNQHTPGCDYECNSDVDCVPKPDCHPKECINRNCAGYFVQPDVCTELFDCSAAYNAQACACVDHRCTNKNIGGKGCNVSV
jgi:hypothetical protein